MARYKKTDIRIWGDEKFRRLTAPKPSAQFLWFRLMIPRESTNIPGLIVVGEAQLAENLGWTLRDFRRCWAEIGRESMAIADWRAQVVFLPNAIKYHEPENPNVIKSWRHPWDEVPECEVKMLAYQTLKSYVLMMEERPRLEKMKFGFMKAFTESLGERYGQQFSKGFREPYAKSGAVAGAVTGTGTGTGAVPSLLDFSNPDNTVVPEKAIGGDGPVSESRVSEEARAGIWGPVDRYLRKSLGAQVYRTFYEGAKILDLNKTHVVIGVPKTAFQRHGENVCFAFIEAISKSGRDIAGDRMVKVVPMEPGQEYRPPWTSETLP